jgi:hypothetical protein
VFGEYFAAAVLLANIALMVRWGLIGPDARRAAMEAAEAELASGEAIAYTPDNEPR